MDIHTVTQGRIEIARLEKLLKYAIIPGADNSLEDSVEYECGNCSQCMFLDDLDPIEDIFLRVAPGELMPGGECPDCGALCHQVGSIEK